jgi:hypothetical protein
MRALDEAIAVGNRKTGHSRNSAILGDQLGQTNLPAAPTTRTEQRRADQGDQLCILTASSSALFLKVFSA